MTGANAAFGEQYMKGAQAAADVINKAGGINGEQIKLVAGDDACEPKQAVAVANRLADQDKVIGVVGHFCSSNTIPASEVYDEAGIIAITPGSTNPQVTERGLGAMFRMCGRDDQQGIVAGDYIVDVLKGKKVAVINDKDTYGKGLADATAAQLTKRGVKPVLEEGLTRGEKDFSALVTKIRSLGADVVYFGGLHLLLQGNGFRPADIHRFVGSRAWPVGYQRSTGWRLAFIDLGRCRQGQGGGEKEEEAGFHQQIMAPMIRIAYMPKCLDLLRHAALGGWIRHSAGIPSFWCSFQIMLRVSGRFRDKIS